MKKCPFCAEEVQDEAIKCRHCGEMLVKAAHSVSSPVETGGSSLGGLGVLLVFGGLLAMGYSLTMDVSVAVPTQTIMGQTIGGGRVNNLGLMQERQNLLIIGGISFVGGLVLTALSPKKRESTASSIMSLIARIVVYGFLVLVVWGLFNLN